jgi:hypothetical protein
MSYDMMLKAELTASKWRKGLLQGRDVQVTPLGWIAELIRGTGNS